MKRNKFGLFLKERRLEVGFGLRSFAVAIEMQPSNLSNMEHGRIPPPQDNNILTRIAQTLGLKKGTNEWNSLFDLAVADKVAKLPSDVVTYAKKNEGIPVLLRTMENKKITKKQLRALTDYVNENY